MTDDLCPCGNKKGGPVCQRMHEFPSEKKSQQDAYFGVGQMHGENTAFENTAVEIWQSLVPAAPGESKQYWKNTGRQAINRIVAALESVDKSAYQRGREDQLQESEKLDSDLKALGYNPEVIGLKGRLIFAEFSMKADEALLRECLEELKAWDDATPGERKTQTLIRSIEARLHPERSEDPTPKGTEGQIRCMTCDKFFSAATFDKHQDETGHSGAAWASKYPTPRSKEETK